MDRDDLAEIEDNLYNPNAYFEIAHYDDSAPFDEPSIILLIDKGNIFIDFMHKQLMQQQLNLIEMLMRKDGKMTSQKELTNKELMERAELLAHELSIQTSL